MTAVKKFKNIAVLYSVVINTPQESVGHISHYANIMADNVDYFCVSSGEIPENQTLESYDVIFIHGLQDMGKIQDNEWFLYLTAMLTDAFHRKQKIIAIGTGSQMMALIMGAKIAPMNPPQIGFHTVDFVHIDAETNLENPVLTGCPRSEILPSLHYDGFHTPIDAIDIMVNDVHQKTEYYDAVHDILYHGTCGFVSENVLALYFHAEITPLMLEYYMDNIMRTLPESVNIQTKDLMTLLMPIYAQPLDSTDDNEAKDILFRMMDNFLRL